MDSLCTPPDPPILRDTRSLPRHQTYWATNTARLLRANMLRYLLARKHVLPMFLSPHVRPLANNFWKLRSVLQKDSSTDSTTSDQAPSLFAAITSPQTKKVEYVVWIWSCLALPWLFPGLSAYPYRSMFWVSILTIFVVVGVFLHRCDSIGENCVWPLDQLYFRICRS